MHVSDRNYQRILRIQIPYAWFSSDNNNEQLTAIVKNMDIDQKTIEVIDAKEQVLDNNNEEAMEIEYDVDADEQL